MSRSLALYGKIERIEPAVGAALVRLTAERLSPVITTMNGGTTPLLPGYRIKILDGNHLPGSQHRIKELRTMGVAALPGHTLVVLDPQLMLVIDAFPCEDGHVEERSLLGQVEATVQPKDLWIDDRNFCIHGLLVRDCPPGRLLPCPPARRDADVHPSGKEEGSVTGGNRPGLRADAPSHQRRG